VAEPSGLTLAELEQRFPDYTASLDAALRALLRDGRAKRQADGASVRYFANQVTIPIGSEAGWETAVFDHYRAVCGALANKIRIGGAAAAAQAWIGGTTLSFDVYPGHPYEAEIKGLLARIRAEVAEVWQRAAAFNAANPPPEQGLEKVIFYAGQNFISNAQTLQTAQHVQMAKEEP
jgi:hypothetical protein